ncbi:MAG: glycosyltransferase family 1 protein [Myxococcaceae bacterium]|nr:MAG: glycosyltransferase family 1 protein [Myxococcaceae bacterium]
MEFVAEMLLAHLQAEHADRYDAQAVRPRFFSLFETLPGLDAQMAWNADRLLTRFVTYPSQLVTKRRGFELFHVADHSYAQVVHVLPAGRTGVYCHDLDAFACILRPNGEGPGWRKAMARTQLSGLQRAAVVFYSTEQVRRQIEEFSLVEPARLVHAPYGVAEEFFSPGRADDLPALPSSPFLLHVGSSVSRKRLDVLFRVFAELRRERPELLLVQQGAQLTAAQRNLVAELGIGDALVQPPRLSRPALAALYGRAELVLLTSEREGFGLPILEGLAAGSAVVASDIPAFREVAGDAVTFCAVEDIAGWVATIRRLLDHPELRPSPARRREVVSRYTWTAHAATIARAYARLADGRMARA